MSLAGSLKEIASKPNESKYALYEQLASKLVAKNEGKEILELAKHCQ
jgi:hypothetical protein